MEKENSSKINFSWSTYFSWLLQNVKILTTVQIFHYLIGIKYGNMYKVWLESRMVFKT